MTADNIQGKLRTLLSMAVVLTYAAQVPIVKVGRMAGQYAKPRSSPIETRGGVTLPAYRGDAVNGFAFTEASRRPDPQRLLGVYNASAATLNLTRAFVTGGFAHLRSVHSWNAELRQDLRRRRAVPDPGRRDRPRAGLHGGLRHRRRRRSVPSTSTPATRRLILEYEHALTRVDSRTRQPYNTSGHLVWIGERTRQLDGAHVEMLRHVRNPLAVKLGPTTHRGPGAGAGRPARSRPRAGPDHLHHPDGCAPDPRRCCPTWSPR